MLGVVILGFISLFHAEGPSSHDELLQDDCLHVNCVDGNLLKVKWGADGEPVGEKKPNVGDKWSTGPSFKGVDNHVEPKLPRCLGAECQQLNREKWGADGEPLDGRTPENVGDTWRHGRTWKAVDEHKEFASPYACVGALCKQKALSLAQHSNVGDHLKSYGALGRPYKGTGKPKHFDSSLRPDCLGGLGTACKVKRRCNYAYVHTHTHRTHTHTHTHTHTRKSSHSHTPLVPLGITH